MEFPKTRAHARESGVSLPVSPPCCQAFLRMESPSPHWERQPLSISLQNQGVPKPASGNAAPGCQLGNVLWAVERIPASLQGLEKRKGFHKEPGLSAALVPGQGRTLGKSFPSPTRMHRASYLSVGSKSEMAPVDSYFLSPVAGPGPVHQREGCGPPAGSSTARGREHPACGRSPDWGCWCLHTLGHQPSGQGIGHHPCLCGPKPSCLPCRSGGRLLWQPQCLQEGAFSFRPCLHPSLHLPPHSLPSHSESRPSNKGGPNLWPHL